MESLHDGVHKLFSHSRPVCNESKKKKRDLANPKKHTHKFRGWNQTKISSRSSSHTERNVSEKKDMNEPQSPMLFSPLNWFSIVADAFACRFYMCAQIYAMKVADICYGKISDRMKSLFQLTKLVQHYTHGDLINSYQTNESQPSMPTNELDIAQSIMAICYSIMIWWRARECHN